MDRPVNMIDAGFEPVLLQPEQTKFYPSRFEPLFLLFFRKIFYSLSIVVKLRFMSGSDTGLKFLAA